MSTSLVRRPHRTRAFRAVAVSVGLLGVAVGCGKSADSPAATTQRSTIPAVETTVASAGRKSRACDRSETTTEPIRSTQQDFTVQVASTERTYKRYVPAGYDGIPAPLVVDLHGYQSVAAGQILMSDLATYAESAGFVVATPQGSGALPYWNAVPHPDLPDDVQFISDVIDETGSSLCIDTSRVYVDGFSNGAFLASLVACRLGDKVAAVATVAGLQVPAGCAPTRPMPIVAMHGTADRFVAFDGGPNVALASLTWDKESTRAFEGLPFAPVRDALAEWARIDGCSGSAAEKEIAPTVSQLKYGDCEDGAVVELYILDGAGHTWPGSAFAKASESLLGPANSDLNATEVIWSFFRDHPLGS